MTDKQYQSGAHGEVEFQLYLNLKEIPFKDTSDDINYQNKDIDLLLKYQEKEYGIEIKWDNKVYKTENLFIEHFNSASGAGWVNFSKADYIAYGDSQARIFYIFSLADLRKFLDERKHNLAEARTYVNTDTGYGESIGYLLPLRYLKKYVEVKEIHL